jgi:hypothetical protein
LRWTTRRSAACVGREHELGEIAVGKAADLALFKLDELRFAGYGDALAAVVHGAAHRADRVMIAGYWAVEDGAIPGLDLPGLIARENEMGRRQAGEHDIAPLSAVFSKSPSSLPERHIFLYGGDRNEIACGALFALRGSSRLVAAGSLFHWRRRRRRSLAFRQSIFCLTLFC